MNEINLYADTTLRQFVSSQGGTPQIMQLVLGDQLKYTLNLVDRSTGEVVSKNAIGIRSVRTSLGKTLEPPNAGDFLLTKVIDDPASETDFPDRLSFDASQADFETALTNAGIVGSEVVMIGIGCWLVRVPAGISLILSETDESNQLRPNSFVRIRQMMQGGRLWHEVRLIQAPWAFSDSFDRVLAEAPSISTVRNGAPRTIGVTANTNEVQALRLPVAFVGTYFLKWDFRTTRILGVQETAEQIAVALNEMWADGEERFKVTNPADELAYIEFTGPLAETDHPEIEVVVHSFEIGKPTIELDLNREEFATALRDVAKIEKVPFEMELEVLDNPEDVSNLAIPGRRITFQQLVTVVREQIWDELVLIPSHDWARPPQPRNYVPFTPDQVITGQQFYIAVVGDGVLRSFVLTHGLATANIANIQVFWVVGGQVLVLGAEHLAYVNDENQVTVALLSGTPTPTEESQLVIIVTSAGPAAAFQAHTHTIPQIVGLQDLLDVIGNRLTAIEDKLPYTTPTVSTTKTKPLEIPVPNKIEMLPGRYPDGFNPSAGIPPSRPPALPSAVHTASGDVIALTTPIPTTPVENRVYQNGTGSDILIPGGRGNRSATIFGLGDELRVVRRAAYDGRIWYPVQRLNNTSTTHYPVGMDRTLATLTINEKMLRAGKKLDFEFSVSLQMLAANVTGQYNLIVELGELPADVTPTPIGLNLKDVVWDTAVPVMSHRITMSEVEIVGTYGVSIIRDITDTYHTDQLLYDAWEASDKVPTTANFALRVRLALFDIENDKNTSGYVDDPKGVVLYKFTDAKASISND